MNREEKISPTIPLEAEHKEDSSAIELPNEPPKIYIASCGTLCDVFWWARRRSD
jgi:hypothetical protein